MIVMVDDDEKDDDYDHKTIVSYVERNSNFSQATDEVICNLKFDFTLYLKIHIFLFTVFT